VNELFQLEPYTDGVKAEILQCLDTLGLLRSDSAEFAVLRRIRGKLLKRTLPRVGQPGTTTVVAKGRSSWIGWVELTTERVDELALTHTARVIRDVGADVLGVVEAESRVALKHFSDAGLLTRAGDPIYPHVMVIDGNDDRGIDVGLMTKPAYPIQEIRSHVDDLDRKGRIFSRDCPEFFVTLPNGERLAVLVNHFKSKGNGRQRDNDARRKRQAARAAAIYEDLIASGTENVAVVGDFNDTPNSDPLTPLLATTLRDITVHPKFVGDGRPGTYANGTAGQKIDYVLLSPALFDRVTGGGFFRKGVWGGVNGTLFPHYETMLNETHAASDHAAVFADIVV
jgi:endonuclease/exonuclease/phosphatase family metal-dependent hydrolase